MLCLCSFSGFNDKTKLTKHKKHNHMVGARTVPTDTVGLISGSVSTSLFCER